jgi:hypothetical protein
LPPTVCTPIILGKPFSFGEDVQDRHIVIILHMHVHKEGELSKSFNPTNVKNRKKLEIDSK